MTPGTAPTPCGAASLHSHMESHGFHSPQTGLHLSAPITEGKQKENSALRGGAHNVHVLELNNSKRHSRTESLNTTHSVAAVDEEAPQYKPSHLQFIS